MTRHFAMSANSPPLASINKLSNNSEIFATSAAGLLKFTSLQKSTSLNANLSPRFSENPPRKYRFLIFIGNNFQSRHKIFFAFSAFFARHFFRENHHRRKMRR